MDDKRGFRLINDDCRGYNVGEYNKVPATDIREGDLLALRLVGGVKVALPFDIATDVKVLGVAAFTVLGTDAKNDLIRVYDDPTSRFRVQASTLAAGDEYKNVSPLAPAAIVVGSQADLLGHSNMTVDGATLAATKTLALKVIGLAREINAEANTYGANADIIVTPNNHVFGNGDGSTGIV